MDYRLKIFSTAFRTDNSPSSRVHHSSACYQAHRYWSGTSSAKRRGTVSFCHAPAGPTSQHPSASQTHVVPISFLPLSPAFNKASTVAWASLAFRVQQWLVYYIRDQHLPHWKWGAEVFWTAFIAAFPSFPLGDWPPWDVRIPMAGTFIEKQVVAADFDEVSRRASECTAEDLIKRREELWEDFCELVKLMYPFPIHYNDSPDEDVN